jgi:hypothetical protein
VIDDASRQASDVSKSDEQLDALLSQGRLSGPERDRILKTVLERSAAARPARWSRWLLGGTVALAAAGAAGVLLIPRLQREPAGFTARGNAPAGADIQIDLGCVDGSLERCPAGSTLLFAVRGEQARGFLGAYARPADGGSPIWYFSAEAESPAVVARGPGLQALSRGIRLGPEHRPGRYQVVVVLGQTSPGRQALLAPDSPGQLARRTFDLTVVSP